jgi:hypothetical protein
MKYLNKKRSRKGWIKIEGPTVWPPFNITTRLELPNIYGPKIWCQQSSSTGGFFREGTIWEFEKAEDALAFRLKFGV